MYLCLEGMVNSIGKIAARVVKEVHLIKPAPTCTTQGLEHHCSSMCSASHWDQHIDELHAITLTFRFTYNYITPFYNRDNFQLSPKLILNFKMVNSIHMFVIFQYFNFKRITMFADFFQKSVCKRRRTISMLAYDSNSVLLLLARMWLKEVAQ